MSHMSCMITKVRVKDYDSRKHPMQFETVTSFGAKTGYKSRYLFKGWFKRNNGRIEAEYELNHWFEGVTG